jgi:hypothetical protein
MVRNSARFVSGLSWNRRMCVYTWACVCVCVCGGGVWVWVCVYVEVPFKELAHGIERAGRCEICRAGGQGEPQGRVVNVEVGV